MNPVRAIKKRLQQLKQLCKLNKFNFNQFNQSYKSNKRYKLNNQKGFLEVIAIVIGLLLVALGAMVLLLTLLVGIGAKNKSLEQGVGAEVTNNDSNNDPTNNDSNNDPTDKTTNQPYKPDEEQDLSTGFLVCVSLPGIRAGRTPALDVRVARRYLAVKQDLDAQGISTVFFTWGFRTNCQQINIRPSGRNPKAKPGTSPHEAGRALDVVGLDPSSAAFRKNDYFKIVKVFQNHGWHWLARKDPPHMHIDCSQVGEFSNLIWIQKAQTDYKKGGPKGGCRGPECGS
jgi:hypothetical protein